MFYRALEEDTGGYFPCADSTDNLCGPRVARSDGWVPAVVERAHHGWDVAPDAFVFSATVVSSFCNLLHLLTAPGDAVLVMTPLYAPLQASVTGCGRRLVCHSLHRGDDDAYRIDGPGTSLERTLDDERVRLVLLCNPQNPTGRVWSEPELELLCARCARRSIPIVSDEIWMDWTLFGARHTPLAPVGARCGCEVVTLGAPTKTWALAGLHSSWLAFGDAAMKARYVARYESTSQLYGSTFATEATLAAYTQGGPWLAAGGTSQSRCRPTAAGSGGKCWCQTRRR